MPVNATQLDSPQGPTPYLPLGSEEDGASDHVEIVKHVKSKKEKEKHREKHKHKSKHKEHKGKEKEHKDKEKHHHHHSATVAGSTKRESKRELRARVSGSTLGDTPFLPTEEVIDAFIPDSPVKHSHRKATPSKPEKKKKEKKQSGAKNLQDSPGRSESAIFNSIGISAAVGP